MKGKRRGEKREGEAGSTRPPRALVLSGGMRHILPHQSRAIPDPTPRQLCDGASEEERRRWRLRPASEFHYLNQSTCFEIPGDSNAEEYQVGGEAAWAGVWGGVPRRGTGRLSVAAAGPAASAGGLHR